MDQIEINDLIIDVVRKPIKNIHLSVYPPTGRARIAAPLSVNDETLKLFAISKLAWIKRSQRKFETQERQSPRAFEEKEGHYFEGKKYMLRVIELNAPPKIEIKNKKFIDIYVRSGTSIEQQKNILNEWYRDQLKKQIPAIIKKWEKTIKEKVSDWGVKQMKTK